MFFRNHKFNISGLSFPDASFSFSYIILALIIDFCYISFLLVFQNFPFHERYFVTQWKFIFPHPQALSDSEILGIFLVLRGEFVNRIKNHPLLSCRNINKPLRFEPRWEEKKSLCFPIAPHGHVLMCLNLFGNYPQVFKASESDKNLRIKLDVHGQITYKYPLIYTF